MAFICKSELFCDFVNAFITVLQTMLDQFGFVTGYLLLHGFPGMLFKIPAQVGGSDAELLADVLRT